MIKTVILRNFQKWKKLTLELSQTTTLVGPSDTGKSAAIRALFWVIFNSPKGSSFIRHGAKYCKVAIVTSDGHTITRKRSAKENVYIVNGEVLKSFKTDPPALVNELLRVYRDSFLLQHDAVYWLSLSPTEISKRLNEIADLSSMDKAIREAQKRKRENKSRIRFVKTELQSAKEECEKLSDVPAAWDAFETLQNLEQQILLGNNQTARLRCLVSDLELSANQKNHIATAIQLWERIESLEDASDDAEKTIRDVRNLTQKEKECLRQKSNLSEQEKSLQDTIAKQSKVCSKCGQVIDQESQT